MGNPTIMMGVHIDIEWGEAARLLNPEQLNALMLGIAQVIAATQSSNPRARQN